MDLTVVVPFYNGQPHIGRLLDTLPPDLPVIVVDDCSEEPLQISPRSNVKVIRSHKKGYFTGAVNLGISTCGTDVLVLNQDTWFEDRSWVGWLEMLSPNYAMIGERIQGLHPAFGKLGYIHGTFMYMRRDALHAVGFLNEEDYPLWGSTAEWQLRVARAGFAVYPVPVVPGFRHERGERAFGSGISQMLQREPEHKDLLIRTPPLISVIIPCYNYGVYLEDCVNSLVGGPTSLGRMAGQTLQSFEIIIVDDRSPDNSWEYAQSLVSEPKAIRVYRLQANVGTAAALNFGIRKSCGKYLTFLSADDMREPGALRALYKSCEDNPHTFAYDDIRLFGGRQRLKNWQMEEYDFETLRYRNQIHAGILYPREAWEQVGGYPEVMRDGREDWAFNVGLGLHGWCGTHVHEPNYLYRREQQNRSLHNTTPEHREKFLRRIMEVYPRAYQGEIPMSACCGKTAPVSPKRGRSAQSSVNGRVADMAVPGSTGMVRLQYQGKQMDSTWTGSVTHTAYRFGVDRQFGWVDNRDVGSREGVGFLSLKDPLGHWIFATKPPSPEPQPDLQPVLQTEPIHEMASPASEPVGIPDRSEELEEPVAKPALDPSDLTIGQIRNLTMDKEGWLALYSLELAGRNRKGVIDFVEFMIADG